MSRPQESASSAGQYAGSAITLTNRRTSAALPGQFTSNALEGGDYPGQPGRGRSSVVRETTVPSRQRETTHLQAKPTRVIRQRRFDRSTLVIWLCLALIAMVGGWWLLSTVASWWQGVQENIKYGSPRTFQADQFVGLGDTPAHPDHFIALNLHGVIEVIQLNPQDRTKDAVYVLASVGNQDTPASLSFRDTTGSGRIDVIVTIGDSTPYTIVLLNNGKTLQPTQPAH
jgi:hypothetical protein